MDKLKPRAIIFDLGSTLIEYEAIPWDDLGVHCVDAGWQYLSKTHLSLPPRDEFLAAFDDLKSEYRAAARDTLIEWTVPDLVTKLFKRIGIAVEEDIVMGFFGAYYERVHRELFMYDDTLDTLKKLKPEYPVMGLVSNTIFPEEVHLKELEHFGIAPYLSFTVFSSTFRVRKPHPDIFYHAANCAGFAPSECLFVGDRYVEDVQGPSEIGMSAVLKVKPGRDYPEEMPEAAAKIDSLAELIDHLEF